MSQFFQGEKARAAEARKEMDSYGLPFEAAEIQNYTTDGHLRLRQFFYAIMEYKEEIGSTGAEPLFQAGWYYTISVKEVLFQYRYSHFPCFLLYAVGEYGLGMSEQD